VGVQSRAVRRYKDNDLVLLSLLPSARDAAAAADDDADDPAAGAHALALVEQAEGTQMLRLRLHLAPGAALSAGRSGGGGGEALGAAIARFATLRAALRATGDASRSWGLQRLCNLSTIQREWLGVHAARSLPFRDVILSATPRPPAPRHWRCPAALDGALAARFNPSQLAAIQAGLETAPVVLIQGPPGTGKTATLQALLSLVMHAVPASLGGGSRRAAAAGAAGANGSSSSAPLSAAERVAAWRAASPWLFGGANARDAGPPPPHAGGAAAPACSALPPPPPPPTLLGSAATRNPHVLVCAPSNSALDEIVLRLLQGQGHAALAARSCSSQATQPASSEPR
jgi:senataxin